MFPFNRARPARIKAEASEREQYPSFDKARAKPIRREDSLLFTSSC